MATTPFHYVYILHSQKDNGYYVGSTSNLGDRFQKHVRGEVKSTRDRRPLELIFYEAYLNKYDAIRREDYLKSSKGKNTFRNMMKEYLANQ